MGFFFPLWLCSSAIISKRSYFRQITPVQSIQENTCRKINLGSGKSHCRTYCMETALFMKLHQLGSWKWRPFWPSFSQHHAQRVVRSADSSGWRLTFVTPRGCIDSIASLSSVLSAPVAINCQQYYCQQYGQDDWHFRTTPWKEELFF